MNESIEKFNERFEREIKSFNNTHRMLEVVVVGMALLQHLERSRSTSSVRISVKRKNKTKPNENENFDDVI